MRNDRRSGTLPDLLVEGGGGLRQPRTALEFRDRPISYAELAKQWSRVAAAAFLRAGYGSRTASVALFLGNSPDHPVNFFGALKAGAARVVHLSHRSTATSRCRTSCADSGARVLVTK